MITYGNRLYHLCYLACESMIIYCHVLEQTIWLQLRSPSPSHENRKIENRQDSRTSCSTARVDALDRSAMVHNQRTITNDVQQILPPLL